LKISVSEFPQFGLLGRKMPQELDSENYWLDSACCAQTQKELEGYELQKIAEDPFRIKREPDLRKARGILQTNTSGLRRSWFLRIENGT
jgi:hypothetical protein